jgi:lipopolysaccharide/colanic/teichoic acid biosynthesis glycosyltransferase
MQSDLEHDSQARASSFAHEGPQAGLKLEPPVPIVVSFFYACWHRIMDIFFGILGMLLLLLLLPLIALLIYLDSPGPVFYSQERVGYRGQKFYVHKLRSMRTDAEQAGFAVWATRDDPRVTRVGRVLRATHLDELPQVINIFRGEMSMIGPRPERPEYVAVLEKASYLYRSRFNVKPGLTGWAQVEYGYGSSIEDELIKLKYDLYYIEHQSFSLDMQILFKTVGEVVRNHGK